ncbi:MAG TPA: SGNH/GDSL hydrolase family protein [Lacipirellulaceae bacterium]|nr:SGNH/GDSL hydrolase family protein [Lacipirellulaceae bacterium]
MKKLLLLALLLSAIDRRVAHAKESLIHAGDTVAVVGDSITEQKQYSVLIEDYLLMCQPVDKLRIEQFGWGGETATGYAKRMQNDTLRFKPTLITTCFGMNDGGYAPLQKDRADAYRQSQQQIVDMAKKAGVRTIVVGSPGCVDADKFRNRPEQATMYNKTLGELKEIAKEVAESNGVVFADVYTPMVDVMTRMKEKYGKAYHLAGPDGVHPDANGHLVMAYAYLKALGCDGDIGSIDVDLGSNKATATGEHKVLSCADGKVEVESRRYPFCFHGEPDKTNATTGVIEFLPFNDELNRFTLKVTNAPAEKYKLTWGETTKEFDREQLAKGINLAAEFLKNPFSEPFHKVENAIREQQNYETPLVKKLVTNVPEFKQLVPKEAADIEKVAASAIERDQELFASAEKSVTPVKHTLIIEAVK